MTTAETAKNLLGDKNCDTCFRLNHCTLDGKEYCGSTPLSESLRRVSDTECKHRSLPKVRTCKDWKSSKSFDLAKVMTPILRRAYPNKIAAEIVSVQPILSDNKSFMLKSDK